MDCDMTVNGSRDCGFDYVLEDKDVITCVERRREHDCSPVGIAGHDSGPGTEGGPGSKTGSESEAQAETDASSGSDEWFDVTVNGKTLSLKRTQAKHMFVDIFNYIDFDLTKPQGTIELRLNGKPAAFTDVIRQGDKIEISWGK